MNVLVDTNIWVDIILRRQPHFPASARVVAILDGPDHSPFACATTVTTVFYLIERARNRKIALDSITSLLQRTQIAGVDDLVLHEATASNFLDFEDAVLEKAAHRAGLDAIVTRNVSDFDSSTLAIFTPAELIASLIASR